MVTRFRTACLLCALHPYLLRTLVQYCLKLYKVGSTEHISLAADYSIYILVAHWGLAYRLLRAWLQTEVPTGTGGECSRSAAFLLHKLLPIVSWLPKGTCCPQPALRGSATAAALALPVLLCV